jgi:pimeloyl-ACP methyl ester carboxylesterase
LGRAHRWIRVGFLVWAPLSTLWLANTMRTRGVGAELLTSGAGVTVVDGGETLEFLPAPVSGKTGLIFLCGAGVAAPAYAPLLRPLAEAGHAVAIVRLPLRIAPLTIHKEEAIARAGRAIERHPEVARWVLSGHSLGAALAARMAARGGRFAGLVLLGTTHPKEDDLSFLTLPVTKVYATRDGVAPAERVLANRRLLPTHTRFLAIEGGNHSQFGHYGRQLFDGRPTISREAQQAVARGALLEALRRSTP